MTWFSDSITLVPILCIYVAHKSWFQELVETTRFSAHCNSCKPPHPETWPIPGMASSSIRLRMTPVLRQPPTKIPALAHGCRENLRVVLATPDDGPWPCWQLWMYSSHNSEASLSLTKDLRAIPLKQSSGRTESLFPTLCGRRES